MSGITPISIGYFGKIPSRSDFVKAGENPQLIKLLDDWLARAMDLLSTDARWKIHYDAMVPLHFAFIGPQQRSAIAGHIVSSNDQTKRRFPFLMMSIMAVEEPKAFVPNSPMVLSRLWDKLEAMSTSVLAATDASAPLQAVTASPIDLYLHANAYEAPFTDFLEQQTVGTLDALLAQSGFTGSVRRIALALGLLLQPVMASSSSQLEKSIVLPLPAAPLYRNLVAAFWMHLITPFLIRADFELSLFITQIQAKPVLVLGFSGASAHNLQAIIDPRVGVLHHIAFDELDWVEDQINNDYAIKKVSSYLAQANFSLKSAHDSVREAFIGT